MTWSSMRGRPRDLPVDHTPLRGARVDSRARVAWLLRVSRMASTHGGTGAEFSRQLGEVGLSVGASALSRREHGQEEASGALISAYEEVLHLPAGHLRGVCDSFRRSCAVRSSERVPCPTRAEVAESLCRLESRIDEGRATGSDWLELSRLLVQPGGGVLPPSVLESWVRRLLREMVHSAGGAYVTRTEALAGLMADSVTSRTVTEAVLELIDEPGASCQIEAIGVLGESREDEVVHRLIDLFVHRGGATRIGAARALLQPIVIGALTVDQANTVQRAVLTVAKDDPEGGGDAAFMLAQRISLRLTRMVVTLLGRNPGERPVGSHIQAPAQLERYLAQAAAHSGLHDDQMLERLVREALTDDFVERQHHSSMMLMVSPFRSILADTAIEILQTVPDPAARISAGRLLRYLAGRDQQRGLLTLLRRPDSELQRAALFALAHAGGVPADIDMLSYAANDGLADAALFAAGMSGHPDLPNIAVSDAFAPDVRQAARWWMQLGPVISEESAYAAEPAVPVAAQGGSPVVVGGPTVEAPRVTIRRTAPKTRW